LRSLPLIRLPDEGAQRIGAIVAGIVADLRAGGSLGAHAVERDEIDALVFEAVEIEAGLRRTIERF